MCSYAFHATLLYSVYASMGLIRSSEYGFVYSMRVSQILGYASMVIWIHASFILSWSCEFATRMLSEYHFQNFLRVYFLCEFGAFENMRVWLSLSMRVWWQKLHASFCHASMVQIPCYFRSFSSFASFDPWG